MTLARHRKKYIEVKTTRQNEFWPMLISRDEVAFSRTEAARFHLYRVFDFGRFATGLYTVHGDVRRTCQLEPTLFEALPTLPAHQSRDVSRTSP